MAKKTIGLLGDGQLAQMTCLAGQALGFEMHVFASDQHNPAALVADRVWVGSFDDREALTAFAKSVSVVTYDTELLPIAGVRTVAEHTRAFPSPELLFTAQNRLRERSFLRAHGIPKPNVAFIETAEELSLGVSVLGTPCVLKTAEQGYDGKGQARIDDPAQALSLWRELGGGDCVLEEWVEFEREMSVIIAGDLHGNYAAYPVIDNEHRHHILHMSVAPSTLPAGVQEEARTIAERIARACNLVGLLTIEMFHTVDGRVIVNELAPRPHNSGHHTQLSAVTSQFAQLCRAITGEQLGSVEQRPAAMINLLGDVFLKQQETPYRHAGFVRPLDDDVNVFFYGKSEARTGRKLGHIIAVADQIDEAIAKAAAQEAAFGR